MSLQLFSQCAGPLDLLCAPGLECMKAIDDNFTCQYPSTAAVPETESNSNIHKRDAALPFGDGQKAKLITVRGSGTVMQGKTTRYHDCCKPSCSWPDKARVNNPVKTCGKDGNTVVDPLSISGCDGGNAYSCTSQQPFVVNSTFAMGFAAANIQGLNEGDRCCACYKLDFDSGPVAGKSMIVQVTNSGDLGENHFDLQIPGGGVGNFNACSAQYNAPEDGWGARYGGISDSAVCSDQLPKALQEGCLFRFGAFFQGADNPTMSFQRVQCPAELTKRSGCKRNDDV